MEGHKLHKGFFSLSYNDKEIKVLELKNGRVSGLAQTNLRSGVVSNGKILRKELFAETLKILLTKTKPQPILSKSVIVAIPESKVFIKILEIPKIPLEKVEQAIKWQAESILPVAQDNVYLDWQQIAQTQNGKIKILITACPKDVIDSLIESLQMVSLNPLSIKAKSGALAGLFSRAPHKPVLIANIEEEETSLIIAKNNIARVSTSVLNTKDDQILVEKIEETIDFYQRNKNERKVEEIVVVGHKEIADLKKEILAKTGLPAKIGHWQGKKINIDSKNELFYLVNLALASNPFEGVNLLPEKLKENIQVEEMNLEFSFIKKLFLLFVVILIFVLSLTMLILKFELDKTNVVLKSAQKTNISPNAQEIENQIKDLQGRLDRTDQLKSQRSSYYLAYNKLSNVSQESVKILTFGTSEEPEKFIITGTSATRTALLEYKSKLQQNGSFKNIAIPLKSLERPENINFEIYFNIGNN